MHVDAALAQVMNTFGIGADPETQLRVRAILDALHTSGVEFGKRQLAEDIRLLLGAAAQPGR